MSSKLLLPRLGGAPAVWTTCLLFFQAALLAGYGYAHVSIRILGTRRQAVLHAILVAASLAFIPVSLSDAAPPPGDAGAAWLLGLLTTSIGVPFVLLASGAPLAQRWLADTSSGRDPYHLYAASNLGSLLALLSYPFVVEPLVTLSGQTTAWSAFYAVLCVTVIGIALRVRKVARDGARESAREDPKAAVPAVPAITVRDRARWVAYAAVPSSLLMGSTSYLSTDIAAFPLIWVLPLSLYLLSFAIVFARRPLVSHSLMVLAEPQLIVLVALLIFWNLGLPVALSVLVHLALLFVVAMVCHGELSRSRPHERRLTEFYVWLAVGGLIGGAFNAVAAPLIFSDIREYPIAIALAALLRPRETTRNRILDFAAPVVFGVALLGAALRGGTPPELQPMIVMMGTGVVLFSFRNHPLRFSLGLAALFVVATLRLSSPAADRNVVESRRSFFGVYRILEDHEEGVRIIEHGTTLHGAQFLADEAVRTPLSYYSRQGPVGDIFSLTAPAARASWRVGVVGLGVGSLSCHGREGERWTYFEIDPLVEAIARDTRHFTFLRDCPPESRVVLGDARLTLRQVPDRSFDLLVVDAFSSDAIPLHLMTLEAFRDYFRVLSPDGVLAVHISNQHVDLAPVLAAIAGRDGLTALVRRDLFFPEEEGRTVSRLQSIWVAMAASGAPLGRLVSDSLWRPLRNLRGTRPWTDDYSNVLSVLRWR